MERHDHRYVRTSALEIAYETGGPGDGRPVLLLHGWPDDVRAFDGVRPVLEARGFRTVVPWLRGFGATRFLSEQTPRSGQIVAMAQDAIDLMDALGIDRFAVVGHDWGARIAYALAALFPARVERIVTCSLGWQPGAFQTPSFDQARAFWYQWFLATRRGAEVMRAHGVAFARYQWDTWSPPGWFAEATFAATARAFENPDWAAITLHAYRVRWDEAEPDPRYADLERRLQAARAIDVPTLLIHGGDDRCVPAAASEGKEPYFTGGYARHVLPGIGHFPPREAAGEVAALAVRALVL